MANFILHTLIISVITDGIRSCVVINIVMHIGECVILICVFAVRHIFVDGNTKLVILFYIQVAEISGYRIISEIFIVIGIVIKKGNIECNNIKRLVRTVMRNYIVFIYQLKSYEVDFAKEHLNYLTCRNTIIFYISVTKDIWRQTTECRRWMLSYIRMSKRKVMIFVQTCNSTKCITRYLHYNCDSTRL